MVASPNCCKSPKSRQGHGVGSPKSCKTKKGDLRREENATAADIRTRMRRSEFARLLEDDDEGDLVTLPAISRSGRPAFSPRARRDPLGDSTKT